MRRQSMLRPASCFRPILHLLSCDSTEFVGVGADQRQVVRVANRSDLQVVWPDDLAVGFQIMPDGGVVLRGLVIERADLGPSRQELDRPRERLRTSKA